MVRPKTQRPLILLELVIAFALVSASALPFIRSPLRSLSKELELLFCMELERIAEEELINTRAAMYMDEDLSKSLQAQEKIVYQKKVRECKLSGELSRRFEKEIILIKKGSKKGADEKETNLWKIQVIFKSLPKSKSVLQVEGILFL